MTLESEFALALLKKAAAINGIAVGRSQLIRNGSHVMWATEAGVVARVGEIDAEANAKREVLISRWLRSRQIHVVRAIDGPKQPTVVDGYPVTWWELLPRHRQATPRELGKVLRKLHDLPTPADFDLPHFSPSADVRDRLMRVQPTLAVDHEWMMGHLDRLEREYADIASELLECPIHGDAWQGNFAVVKDLDPIVLDLEAFCIGPNYWDLVPLAVDYTDFSRVTRNQYMEFVAAYGFDITGIPSFRTLADIQELRWTSYVIGKAPLSSAAADEASHRIACLKGEIPRPWVWQAF